MTHLRPRLRSLAAVCAVSLTLAGEARAQVLSLSEALDAAMASHPMVAAADARVLSAEGAGDAARAARLPGAALTANLTHFQEPMVVAPLHSLSLANPPVFDRTLVQGQLGAQYTLFDGGARTWRIRGADAVWESTRAARESAGMRVLEETLTAYLATTTARALVEAASAQVAALDAEHARAERHFEAGAAARLEVLRAEAVRQEALAARSSALARAELAERGLSRLMGVEPDALTGRPLAAIALRDLLPSRQPVDNPAVRKAERTVAAAEARFSEERAGRLPSVSVGAGVQDFGTAEGDHVLEWRTGVELSWPLFTGGARSASVRRAAADLDVARAELEATRRSVAYEFDAATTAIVEADGRVLALAAAVAQWGEVARIEALALEAGSGEQRDLLRAEAGLFEARAGEALARQDALLARVRLARVEGVLTREWIAESVVPMETR